MSAVRVPDEPVITHTPWSQQIASGKRLPMPGPVFGPYPLRDAPEFSSSASVAWLSARLTCAVRPAGAQQQKMLRQIRHHTSRLAALPLPAFAAELGLLRAQLAVHGFVQHLTAQSMAAVAVVVQRHLGWQLHDAQLLGAWWMLERRLIEMATGEGKSVTVVLAAATAALAGVPVHVMTSNDYLARRDAQQWLPIYADLGLKVAWVVSADTAEDRQRAYLHDVVYVTAKEVAFDHLRDRVARAQGRATDQVLRGLCMAIIDEADSILIDEACTPLVLSQTVDVREVEQRYRLAIYLAGKLKAGRDFECAPDQPARLLHTGAQRLAKDATSLPGPWRLKRFREEQGCLALMALHVLKRDVHYLVRDDEVHIIDGTTGRLAFGRAWSRGLHQMVCIKEHVKLSPETLTLVQTTYQEFFPRYHLLGGLSGTLAEENAELLAIYGAPVVSVPLRQPSRREDRGLVLLGDIASKWRTVALQARHESSLRRAVLIGVDSVADSEILSALLTQDGVPHRVLNATHDGHAGDEERSVIEAAGLPGAVTVATHMAGRGTDIQPHAAVLESGGLHVINTHLNASSRIDRQLYGRAGRQGQVGSHQCVLSWQDEELRALTDRRWLMQLLSALGTTRTGDAPVPAVIRWLCRGVQILSGRRAARQRWVLLQTQQSMRKQTAWAGRDDWM
jgi:preprotein translocase subunit SecA